MLIKKVWQQGDKCLVWSIRNQEWNNGKIVKGVAFNGCGDNPVIIGIRNSLQFLDGSMTNWKIIRKKCFTKTGGSGKSREDLKLAIDSSISFLKSKLN